MWVPRPLIILPVHIRMSALLFLDIQRSLFNFVLQSLDSLPTVPRPHPHPLGHA